MENAITATLESKNITNYHNQPIQRKGYHIPPRYHHQDTSLWFASVVLRRVWRNLPSSPPWSPEWENSKKPMSNSKSKWTFYCFLLVKKHHFSSQMFLLKNSPEMCGRLFENSLKAMNVFKVFLFSGECWPSITPHFSLHKQRNTYT